MAKKLEEKAADRNDTPAERNPRTQDGGRKRRCNRDFVVLCCCRWNDHWHLLVLSVVLSVYLCAGAGIFVQLEGPAEHARIRDAITNRTRLIEARAHIVGNITATGSLTEQEALELVFMIGNISAADATLDFSRNWEYGPAIFFATTVITTIGTSTCLYACIIVTSKSSLPFTQGMVALLQSLSQEDFSAFSMLSEAFL